MDSVVTLIADPAKKGLGDGTAEKARAALRERGAETRRADWLAIGIACDIAFSGLPPHVAQKAVKAVLENQPFDVIAQPFRDRRKHLLMADMDSTIVTSETLDDLAAHAGIRDKIAAITARAMNGELDFKEALRERVGMLKDLPRDRLQMTWEETRYTPGAEALVRTMRRDGAYCVLVSGGFDFFTSRVAAHCGFHEDRSNRFEFDGDWLTGRVIEPILDKDSKLSALLDISATKEIPLELALTVGDGANDIPMIKAAGLGIAFHGKPAATRDARFRIDHGDLTALLYAQGYRYEEIAKG